MHRHLLTLLLIPAPARPSDIPTPVVGIADGDTLTDLSGRVQARIRPQGIDAPEAGQDDGGRAKQVASELAFGKEVTLGPVTRDRYGRTTVAP